MIYDATAIEAAAKAAKLDAEKMPDLLLAVYPLLVLRTKAVRIRGSMHTPEDLAAEVLPWVEVRLRDWPPERCTFVTWLWDTAKWRMAYIAQRDGRSMRRPLDWHAVHQPSFSPLDAPLHEDGEATLADTLRSPEVESSVDVGTDIPMESLSKRERTILEKRYIHRDSLDAIAKACGTSRQAIHQSLGKSLKKLKQAYTDNQAYRLARVFILLILASCTAIPTSPRLPALQNDCLPQAISMVRGLGKYDIPAEVLIMQYGPGQMGHAISVYRYKNRKYGWDRHWGSVELTATWFPVWLAWDWHAKTRDTRFIVNAFFLSEPEPEEPEKP